MRYSLTVLCLFASLIAFSQEKTITIDYTVDYTIPNNRKNTTDTISIGYQKNGKYIWTNSKALAKSLGKSLFKRNPDMLKDSELSIIFDTEHTVIMMSFKSGKNQLFFNFELETFLPKTSTSFTNNEDREFELISENTNESIDILDNTATIYEIYPSNKPSEIISVAFDESIAIENNTLFKKVFELVFAAEGNSSLLGMNMPNGLIMQVTEKEETLIEAHKIDSTTKTININYSFKITE